jgi:ATP-dependent helicase HrpA
LDFEQVFNHGIGSVVGLAQIRGDVLGSLLDSLVNLRQALRIGGGKIEHARSDIENQLAWLFCHETLMFASSDDIQQYPRFVKALNLRVEKLSSNMTKDKDFTASVKSYLDSLSALNLDHDLITIQLRRSIVSFRWSLEELRVSLFAQQLKTRYPVSFKRLDKKWLALNDEVSRIL